MQSRLLAATAGAALALGSGCLHRAPPPAAPAAAPAARAAGRPMGGARQLSVNGLATNWGGPNGLSKNGLGSNWGGPNGVHPGALPAGEFDGTGKIDSPEFASWFAKNPAEADKAMVYFVRCAYAAGTVIRYTDAAGKTWSWPGLFGLAQKTFLADRRMDADEGRWVSACLLAHVNMKGTHQYISLRGNPPGDDARSALAPTAAERWTMSYPEGVFSGDNFLPTGSGGYTFGLDLPPAYGSSSPVWQPPSLVLGRTLDFDGWAPDPLGGANDPYLRVVGPYLPNRWRFSLTPAGSPAADPDYRYDTVCTGAQGGSSCSPTYRPLFVHEALLANFEDPSPAAPGTVMQVLDTGSAPIDRKTQVQACAAGHECIGAMPGSGARPGPGAKLVALRAGQSVQGVLRLTEALQQKGLAVPPADQAYTAIVRYASAQGARARVRVSAKDGSLRDVSVVPWRSTGAADAYEWLQVYPVYAAPSDGGKAVPTLRIEIAGIEAPPGGAAAPAPELDAVGFVPGWPWCSAQGVEFAQNCPR